VPLPAVPATSDFSSPGATPAGCALPSPGILLLSWQRSVYWFDPETYAAELIGPLNCSGAVNSMAVARDGTIWIGGTEGELYTANLDTLTCQRKEFNPGVFGNHRGGTGLVADLEGVEHFYVAPVDDSRNPSGEVTQVLDLHLQTLGIRAGFRLEEPLGPIEFAGTGDSRLFGLTSDFSVIERPVTTLIQFDPCDMRALRSDDVSALGALFTFDFAFWKSDIYIFEQNSNAHSALDEGLVYRYQLESQELTSVVVLPFQVVGADATTCAPL
jgi:hypothetical protein